MKRNFKFGVDANVLVQLFDKDGNLKEQREIHNAVTTAGKNAIADQILASPSLNKMTHMELGTGTGGTTALNAYIAGSRVAFTTKTRSNAVVTVVGTFGAGVGTGNITEAGTFDAATENGGNMWMYSSFTSIPKGASDSLTITWTLTVA